MIDHEFEQKSELAISSKILIIVLLVIIETVGFIFAFLFEFYRANAKKVQTRWCSTQVTSISIQPRRGTFNPYCRIRLQTK